MPPRAIVIRTAGTNCDAEMVRGFELAGAEATLLHVDRLLDRPALLDGFDLIGFAGGFSYGDDCGAGRVLAVRIRERLLPALLAAVGRGAPIIGACNGFQVLVQTGLLPGPAGAVWEPSTQRAALAANASGRFIDDWAPVSYDLSSRCLWTRGFGPEMPDEAAILPIAHGEGRFVVSSPEVLRALEEGGRVALRYRTDVNGSEGRIAGICDETGRIFGLMPHPERFLSWRHHPWWTRLPASLIETEPPGLRMFRNAVRACGDGAGAPSERTRGTAERGALSER